MKRVFVICLILANSFFAFSDEKAKENDFDINLWPILSYKDNSEGGKDLSALFIFNRKTDGEGNQKELFLFPLFYNFKKENGSHFGSLLYFNGPDYRVIPPLLSASWTNFYGEKSTWITPLYHSKKNSEGKLESLHFLTYFYSPGRHIFAPLAWNIKTEYGRHHGFIPLYAKGPKYWTVPLGLSLSWENYKGERTTWITPLYHLTKDSDDKLKSFHLLNIYRFRDGKEYHNGFFPLWFKGRDYWLFTPLLSGSYTDIDSDRNTWITPLFHLSLDKKKKFKSFHFINTYAYKDEDGTHKGFFPLWLDGPDYWFLPPLLSYSNTDKDNNRTTWITPLFHLTLTPEKDVKSMHFLNYYNFKDDVSNKSHKGVVPLWFSGPGYNIIPPLLTASWTTRDKSKHLWITPFFHQKRSEDKDLLSFHYFNYYGYKTEKGWKKGFAPFFYIGPDYWVSPLLLSASWKDNKGYKNTWITPLYHKKVDRQGELVNSHLLNYYSFTDRGNKKHWSLFPLMFKGPDYWVSPPILSGGWENSIGDKTTWITPLFHKTENKEGEINSLHFLNYYKFKSDYKSHSGLVPLYFKGDNYLFIPPLLSGSYKNRNSESYLWITPLFHKSKDKEDNLTGFHFLNFIGDKEEKGWRYNLFPLFNKGPEDWYSPILLSGFWREGNKKNLWLTPLFHISKKETGVKNEITSMHLGPYINFDKNKHFIFPIAWYWGKDHPNDSFHYGLLPLFVGGKDYFISPLGYGYGGADNFHFGLFPIFAKSPKSLIIPPLLTASWIDRKMNKRTWITPLFHKNSDSNGDITSLHLLNYFYTPKFSTFFPIQYSWKTEKGRYSMLFPPFIGSFKGEKLSESLLFNFQPILYQSAGDSYEFNFLWRLFHIKRDNGMTELTIGPFWNSDSPLDGRPMEFQVLGGLFARDVNYILEQYRYRALWIITLGTWRDF